MTNKEIAKAFVNLHAKRVFPSISSHLAWAQSLALPIGISPDELLGNHIAIAAKKVGLGVNDFISVWDFDRQDVFIGPVNGASVVLLDRQVSRLDLEGLVRIEDPEFIKLGLERRYPLDRRFRREEVESH
jgi:hypothetical protein